MTLAELLFYILLCIVFYTYVGYGLVISMLVKLKKRKRANIISYHELPHVTLLIAAYNEEKVVEEKMDNCMRLKYPKDKLHIIWITDGSNDNTNELLKKYEGVKVYYNKERKGKTAALNRGMEHVNTPITIFTDANTLINPEAIDEIVHCFSNQKVGCVAGEKRIVNNTQGNNTANNEGLYWKYESTLKKLDYELYSTVGAAGELYAIRTELFEEMPDDTLLDDFILSMRIAMRGYKIAYCDKAYACESGSANIKEEGKRKVRIAAGGIQSICRLKGLLNIFKYKTLSFQYISHRVLRWSVTPIALITLIPLNVYLSLYSDKLIFDLILVCQIIFYTCGILGSYLSKSGIRNKYINVPFYFLFMNINIFKGLLYLITKKKNDGTWEKSLRA